MKFIEDRSRAKLQFGCGENSDSIFRELCGKSRPPLGVLKGGDSWCNFSQVLVSLRKSGHGTYVLQASEDVDESHAEVARIVVQRRILRNSAATEVLQIFVGDSKAGGTREGVSAVWVSAASQYQAHFSCLIVVRTDLHSVDQWMN